MPDLKEMCEEYMSGRMDPEASIKFIKYSGLCIEKKRRFFDRIISVFSNSRHNWLWDYKSTEMILKRAGFKGIRACNYHDSSIKAFEIVENADRFKNCLAIEAIK
ncbi:hypothetical protein [Treponema primitia]|uniref:hypothetical protein n=1 Tax=Treponema primitia TaxID=88058 RepID=UPI0006946617|nr:hypothetical protein [Treponema primitia]